MKNNLSFQNAVNAAIRIFYEYGAVNPDTIRAYYGPLAADLIGPQFIAMRIAAYKQNQEDVALRVFNE